MRGAFSSTAPDGIESTAVTGRPLSRATASAAPRSRPFRMKVPEGNSRPPALTAEVARRTSPPAFHVRFASRNASLARGETRKRPPAPLTAAGALAGAVTLSRAASNGLATHEPSTPICAGSVQPVMS
ncbi:MAG: hypothetical protein DMF83_00255 [Acidobacteria bacterium]|nr:MAG: hypothetical protein DMF83_00255 [Acidobacteriota bacterium]